MKGIGVGVVGLGFMGATHLAALEVARASGMPCRLAAVCDERESRRTGRRDGRLSTGATDRLFDPAAVHAFATVDELLACDEVDAVSVCTPTDSHVELGRRVLETGRHLLMEKPIAVTAAAARPLVDAAAAAPGLAMPALCMRFWPGWTWLLERAADGALGAIRAATFRRLSPAPTWAPGFYDDPARSGGALVDLHVHDADFVRALLGDPVAVSSGGTLDHVTTLYHFDGGPAHVQAEGAWDHAAGFAFRMAFVADFDDATAELDSRRDAPLTLSRAGGSELVDVGEGAGYVPEMRHFLRAVLGEEPLRVTMEDALATARLLDAEREALTSRGTVDLR